jgi:Domain of unknown function (DUF4249)
MRQTKNIILFWMLAIMLPTCIIPYEPHIDSKDINKFVVSGQVTDNNEFQTVSVSMASPIGDPHYIPVSGCYVRIYDDKGNEFTLPESKAGIYNVEIDGIYLIPGTSFKVEIVTPDGINLESDFDQMGECPEVDSVYYIRKNLYTNVPGQVTEGIQFYLNLDGENIESHYFRWEVFETWEYHVDYAREWFYDGMVHHIFPPDYSRKVCWATQLVKNIYTLSTENLVENKFEMLPLNFVDNHTSRLMYGYSLLVNQVAMSEAAYSYWDQLRINSSEQGGLYEKQPLSITGNLHNNTNPDQKVLGFFSASSVKSKRIFIRNVENLELDFSTFCSPGILWKGLIEISPEDYPAFLMGDKNGFYMVTLSNECVDCLSLGGTNIKPDFWPY